MVIIISPGSQVASGVPIELSATEFTVSFGDNWTLNNNPGKSVGSSYNYRLPNPRSHGFNSTLFTATAVIDTEKVGRWGNPDSRTGHYYMTGSMLHGLALTGSNVAIIDSRSIFAREFGNGSMTYGVMTGYNLSRTINSSLGVGSHGYVVEYSINIQESQV